MKRFRFSMASVLSIKEKLETQEKILFQTATNRLLEEQEKLNKLTDRKMEYEDRLRQQIQDRLDLLQIKNSKDAILALDDMIKLQKNAVKKAELQVELARQRLDEAIRERKIYEKLRENALDEYKKEMLLEEKKEVDELISYQYTSTDGRTG